MYHVADEGWALQGGMRRRGSDTQGLLERNGSSFSALSVESALLQDTSSEVRRRIGLTSNAVPTLQHPAPANHMSGKLLTAVASVHLLTSMRVRRTGAPHEHIRSRRGGIQMR